jgi:HSP20 family protein
MAMNDLVPRNRFAPQRPDSDPFFSLHREMNRLFDDAFRNFGAAPFGRDGAAGYAWPSVEVTETDKDVKVTAELAGLDEKDIELRVEDNVLTLRGEKRTETEDKARQYSERYYGRFERRLALPAEIDEDAAQATFKNGVLTVTLPKSERPKDSIRRIPIQTR